MEYGNRQVEGRFAWVFVAALLLVSCERGPTSPGAPRTLDAFTPYLTRQLTVAAARQQFGPPDEETGSGLRIYVYRLADGRELWLGFPGDAPIMYAHLKSSSGEITDLPLR